MNTGVTWDPVAFWARTRPEKLALRMGEERWSYARLEEAVSEAAVSLFAQGLVSGEHISIEFGADQGLHFATTFHALHRADLLPVPISQRLTEAERVALRQRAQVDFALTAVPESAPSSAGSSRVPGSKPPGFERRLDAPAAICFTSGTEGAPRAVVLTHGNFLSSALASARNLGVLSEDLWLSCLPLHHVGGLSVLTRSAYYGTSVLIHDRFHPDAVNHAIDREAVTLVSLVPPMLERLLDARGDRPFPPSIRAALVGGGPAPAELLQRAANLGLRALPTYGLTETTSQVTTLSPREWPAGLDTVGRPLPFVRLEVQCKDGRALGPGEEGEIAIRGPMVAEAYFDDRRLNETAFDRHWFHTGDFGAWDEAGRLRVLDRRGDRLVVGGENVSPAEVEGVLARHPAVAEVCVVAMPAGAWGQEVAAAVVLRPGATLTLEDLREFAGRSLASFKLPRRLHIAGALPRNASGKVLRGEVRGWFAEEMAEKDRA
ncbi:MAG TPA: AMP-binding protein [Candidatus Eisenbacteria bacterium]